MTDELLRTALTAGVLLVPFGVDGADGMFGVDGALGRDDSSADDFSGVVKPRGLSSPESPEAEKIRIQKFRRKVAYDYMKTIKCNKYC